MATTVLGLSAYLTDTQTYSGTFRTASGTELGFQLTGETYDDTLVIPGDTIPVNAIASISQPNDLYLFVEIDASSAFKLEGFKSAYWRPVSEDSNTYYYGTANALVPLGTENGDSVKILDGLKLSEEAVNDQNFNLTITGYAIQAQNIEASSDPSEVLDMAKEL